MNGTTFKVEGELLDELQRAKPAAQTLAAFVRDILRQEMERRRMVEAAERYDTFLRQHPEERAWLAEWDRADLVEPPRRRRR